MADINESTERLEGNVNRFTLTDILHLVLSNWYWFLLSILLCGIVGAFYLHRTAPIYQRTATVLVKDSRKGSGTEVTAFNDLLGGMGRRSVDNEIHIFKSRRLMEEVVKKYDLTTNYYTKGRVRTRDMYGRTPVLVKFVGDEPLTEYSFRYTMSDDNTLCFSQFSDHEGISITAAIGDTVVTPLGSITTKATPYLERYRDQEIIVFKMPLNEATELYRKRLKCEISDKQASVITLTFNDRVPRRAENVINGIIDAYNIDAIQDKQEISNLTEEFINERLITLGEELNLADSDIASFKQDNRLYSPENEARMSAEEIRRLKTEALSLEANIEMAEYIREYLNEQAAEFSLIPAATVTMSGASAALTSQIDNFNRSVLEYRRLQSSSAAANPVLIDLANQITAMRSVIIESLTSHIEGLRLQVEHINREQSIADSHMQSSPTREMELLSKARQQKVKEELYIYLLTKLEENALTGATAESNARIIDRAYGSNKPISPKKSIVFLLVLIMGVAIPFTILYLREILNTSVRSRRDIDEALTIPFLGDIPRFDGKIGNGIVVREDGRDAVSESFRMLRTNLSFMAVDRKIQVIMLTSSIPHSGKTFVSSNLALTLATSGKRVLVIDFDIRRRTFSKQMGHRNDRRGLTSYLSNKISSLNDIITPSEIDSNLDFIFSGPQPPNPAEMLMSQRVDQFMEELRGRYDYIILDSVPAMAVADAMIIDRLVDLTIYVIRQGNLDRRHLPDIEKLHREKKFHNMSIVLNGVTNSKRTYGYGTGYGYGYGYYSENDDASPWRRRWKSFTKLFKKRD